MRVQHPSFDVIFHLAAFIPYGAMNRPDERFQRVNVDLTNELLTAFPNARFIYASSVAVFGLWLAEDAGDKRTGYVAKVRLAAGSKPGVWAGRL